MNFTVLKDWESARTLCKSWRDAGDVVVFTNGCFDILHKGHVQYLEKAAQLGDKLVIGLNSDASTRRLKGAGRPINDEESRGVVLLALRCVNAVVVFGEDTPLELIRTLDPHVLVKGGDYTEDEVVGGDHVRRIGGKVVIIPFVEGYSTTSIEKRILDSKQG